MDIIETGKKVFKIEIDYLIEVMKSLDDRFINVVEVIHQSDGKVVITGMGKPGYIARKIVATMSSLGVPAFFLHPAEAAHGDLGIVQPNDIVIIISNSGESSEIIRILPNIKLIGAKIVAITSNADSTLAKHSNFSFILPKVQEACPLNLAPTSSTTAELVFGDALAIVLSRMYGFTEQLYGLYHPEGSLGKKLLLKVCDVMRTEERHATALINTKLTDVISVMCKIPTGFVTIIDLMDNLLGVFSDGDVRRCLERGIDIYDYLIDDVMTKTPYFVNDDRLAIEIMKQMEEKEIYSAPVLNENGKVVGTILHRDIKKAGVMI